MSLMSRRFSLLFYLKKQKNVKCTHTIYMRLTVNGIRTEISTQKECPPDKWNASAERAKGTRAEIRTLNGYLDLLQAKVYEMQRDLLAENKSITGELIKNRITEIEQRPNTLIAVIQQHNEMLRALIGKTYAKATWVKYETSLKHIREFLKWKYAISDMDIRDIQYVLS